MKSSSPSTFSRLSVSYGSEMTKKYEEIISTLPKREAPHPSPDYYQYQGFWSPLTFLEPAFFMQEHFKAQSSDIFMCSSMKTGTTWLKALSFSIITRDRFDDSTNPLLTKVSHNCVPSLEVDSVRNPSSFNTELPLLATHLPYTFLPRSIVQSDCKIIYICREPKDTFVSLWHYNQSLEASDELVRANTNIVTLEQEVKRFCEGQSIFGPYWDHVLGYWKASIDRPERVFFIKYEDLKSDTLCYVKKLAEFMGKPFSKEEENQGVAEKIVARCHIKSLSNLEVSRNGSIDIKPWRINNSSFYRKGEVGDWKNLLTEDMTKSIDHITHEKFQSIGLTFPVSTQCKNNTKH